MAVAETKQGRKKQVALHALIIKGLLFPISNMRNCLHNGTQTSVQMPPSTTFLQLGAAGKRAGESGVTDEEGGQVSADGGGGLKDKALEGGDRKSVV